MLTRRGALAAGLAAPWGLVWPVAAGATPDRPAIRPRSDWATAQQPVRGTLRPETDVRFLLVHHTLTPNTDAPGAIAGRLRSIHAFHTRERGWVDVAYNFFVDPFGVIWEGRRGSIAGPVEADATGGSQGFAQLACFVGDFTSQPPTREAMDAMVGLLAWLAARSGLPLEGTVGFTSRGSSRWPRGAAVTTARIAGHRDMSHTECPGDALYPLVASQLLPRAAALVASTRTPTASPAPGPSGSLTPSPAATPLEDAAATPSPTPDAPRAGDGLLAGTVAAVVAGVAAAGAAGVVAAQALRRRGASAQHHQDGHGAAAEDHGGDESDAEADQHR